MKQTAGIARRIFANTCFLFYELSLSVFLLFFFPYVWRRIRPEKKYPFDWKERFGIYPKTTGDRLGIEKRLWFHTVSVGELLSITPLINLLRERHPRQPIGITVITKTGRKIAQENFPEIPCFFLPFDISFITSKALRIFNPKLIAIVETELWPGLLKSTLRKNIPVIMINGRISPVSFRGYRKFRFFSKEVLPFVNEIVMRTEEESQRIIYLGADPDSVQVAGSIKFDQAFSLGKTIKPSEKRKEYGIPESKTVIVLGSLHPGEEEACVNIAQKLIRKYPDILIVIVPRFLDRTNIFKILEAKNVSYAKRSRLPENKNLPLWVIDTYGELNNFYSMCACAFVGGSLIRWGGQNPIEPPAFRKPVLLGPYNWYFTEEWNSLKESGGGIEVKNFAQLFDRLCFLIEHPEKTREIGEKAYQVVLNNRGATEKNLSVIEKYLDNKI